MLAVWEGCAIFLQERLAAMGLKEECFGQIVALTLGNRDFLTPETRQLYREAGAAHLLALSGMHMGILYGVFGMVMRMARFLWNNAFAVVLCRDDGLSKEPHPCSTDDIAGFADTGVR